MPLPKSAAAARRWSGEAPRRRPAGRVGETRRVAGPSCAKLPATEPDVHRVGREHGPPGPPDEVGRRSSTEAGPGGGEPAAGCPRPQRDLRDGPSARAPEPARCRPASTTEPSSSATLRARRGRSRVEPRARRAAPGARTRRSRGRARARIGGSSRSNARMSSAAGAPPCCASGSHGPRASSVPRSRGPSGTKIASAIARPTGRRAKPSAWPRLSLAPRYFRAQLE